MSPNALRWYECLSIPDRDKVLLDPDLFAEHKRTGVSVVEIAYVRRLLP